MFHNLYICSCITCCLIAYNCLYYHALCGAFSETRATQSMAYPLASKLDPVTLTFDLENQ